MARADLPGGRPPIGRARVVPQPLRLPRRPWLGPLLRGLLEQALVAGPILGVLSALYGYHLSRSAPLEPDVASHAVLRQALCFHGRFVHAYYITPGQNALWWALSGPAMAWLVLGIGALAGMGISAHYRPRGR